MSKAVSIHEAKSNLSKYIKQAKTGKEVYIGAYGKSEVKLIPATEKNKIKFGILKGKLHYKDKDIMGPDTSISKMFKESINKPLSK